MSNGLRACAALLVAVTSLGVTGCAPGLHTREAGALGPLEVHAVDWNPAKTEVRGPRAVADTGELVAVFSDDGSWVFRGGALQGHVTGATGWRDAATIVAADGSPRWIVGVDGRGRLLRLRGASSFEDVSARYGLPAGTVRGAAMLDGTRAGFLLAGKLAVADGERVTRYGVDDTDLRALAGNGGYGAAVAKDEVVSVRASDASVIRFALPDAAATAVTSDGHVYASTPRALYTVGEGGALDLLYVAPHDQLHGLTAAGDHVWFGDGTELGMARGTTVNETKGANIAADARLFASPGGDVWVVGGGHVQKYSSPEDPTAPGPTTDSAWATSLSPIFARNCAACHQPGGSSGVDLSSLAAWRTRKGDILEQVVVTRSMPPGGRGMTDADRETIHSWVVAQNRR
jgi:mono/diheme cytochrome c family protein